MRIILSPFFNYRNAARTPSPATHKWCVNGWPDGVCGRRNPSKFQISGVLKLVFMLCAVFSLLLSSGMAAAQDAPASPDYEAWAKLAGDAEQVLAEGQAPDTQLDRLRAELATWREAFLTGQDVNAARIATAQSQIAALGPVPDTGESPEITARRAELATQLTDLRAPVIRAEEAYTRADGLIAEIDGIIRDRQARALLSLGPSPLNLAYWPQALTDLSGSLQNLWGEFKTTSSSTLRRNIARQNLPISFGLAVIGVMLLARGRRWPVALIRRMGWQEGRNAPLIRFALSLGLLILPLLGILALCEALKATGLMGTRWLLLLNMVPLWAGLMLLIHWLTRETFHESNQIATLPINEPARGQMRSLCDLLVLTYVIKDILATLGGLDSYKPVTYAVLDLPLLVLAGIALLRLGRLAMSVSDNGKETPLPVMRLRLLRLVGRAAMAVGLAGPALAAIGYARIGEAVVYPFLASLALAGFVILGQRLMNDLFVSVSRGRRDLQDSLLPVLMGLLLILLSLPVLALIWGARIADLTELWTRFQSGFSIGTTRVSPTDFLFVVVVFVFGYMLTRLLQGALRSSVLPKTKIDQGGQNAIVAGTGYIGIVIAAVVAISAGGLDLSSLAIVAGALSVGVGFGLQNIVSNFVSGIILLIERPISEGDWIEVNGTHGTVKDISVRSTRLETFDRYDLIIPNADLVSGAVANYTRGNTLGRIIVPVGVAYGSDTRKVERILLDIARQHDMVLMNPAPYVYFKGFGADSLDFEIRAILRDIGSGLSVRTEMNHQIYERFNQEEIEVPFAQRDIWIRNPEALTATPDPAG